MEQKLLSERWILLADVTNSTCLFWKLTQARSKNPKALFETSTIYSQGMESIFLAMEALDQAGLTSKLANTMGDGFLLVGRHDHGLHHIRDDAPALLSLAKTVKQDCDRVLADCRDQLINVLGRYDAIRNLPDLKTKIVLHHGYLVTIARSQRLFGDTINFAARVASAAFSEWVDGIVLTEKFADVLPERLRNLAEPYRRSLSLRYPGTEHMVYRVPFSAAEFWDESGNTAKAGSRREGAESNSL